MIQTTAFTMAKDMARLPFGRQGKQRFGYYADVQKQWERTLDSGKILDVIGSLSGSAENLADVRAWLGELTADELVFKVRFEGFYGQVVRSITSAPETRDTDLDFFETLLDWRIVQRHVASPGRVLDIGPGSGRHMANLFLRSGSPPVTYVGVESVGLPYVFQNAAANVLALKDTSVVFRDQIDYAFNHGSFSLSEGFADRSIWHLPLWCDDQLPAQAFDVIFCNYLLDELSSYDFHRVAALLGRCLAPDGVLYCRGSQQRSMLKNLYLFGYGSFHGHDITASLLSQGLRVKTCDLIGSTLTRVFVRADSRTHEVAAGGYATITSDVPLVAAVQADFVAQAVKEICGRGARIVIWVDPGPGYEAIQRELEPHLADLGPLVAGLTNEHITGPGVGPFSLPQVPLADVRSLDPKAAFIFGTRMNLAVRELRHNVSPARMPSVRHFNMPFAWALIS